MREKAKDEEQKKSGPFRAAHHEPGSELLRESTSHCSKTTNQARAEQNQRTGFRSSSGCKRNIEHRLFSSKSTFTREAKGDRVASEQNQVGIKLTGRIVRDIGDGRDACELQHEAVKSTWRYCRVVPVEGVGVRKSVRREAESVTNEVYD